VSSGGTKGAGGAAGASVGAGGATPQPTLDPIIPAVSGDCPTFQDGTITLMGLDGIKLAVGKRQAEGAAPMLFYWHGTGSTSDEYTNMAAPVATGIIDAGGVIVSFQGTTGGDLYSGTNIFGKGDLVLTDQLVACAVRDAGIDPRRIYTTGCSAGGIFATSMAALRSSYVAAVAPNSGGEVVDVPFQNSHTPPLMAIHGAPGSTLVIDFAQTALTAEMAFKGRGGFAIDCNTRAGSCSGAPLAGDVWTFFQAHPFGADPEPWTASLPPGFSSECLIQ